VTTHAMRNGDAYEANVITLDEFRASRDVWNALVASMAQPTVFLSWEWIYTWWEHFGTTRRELLIFFVYRNRELKGILPLFRDGGYTTVGRTFVGFCSADELYPDHLDIIAAPADADACLESVYEFLFTAGLRWSVIEFPMVTLDSAIYGCLCAKTDHIVESPRVEVARASIAHYIPLDGDFDGYFVSLDKKQRYNVRSRRTRLYTEHHVRYTARSPSPDCLTVLLDLHRKRADRKGIVSSFARDAVRAFHDKFIERTAHSGWVSFRFLEGAGGPIAAAYNFVFAGRVYSYQKGIDPAWERFGPGTVLLYELVQEAFAQGLKEYNFLQGAETYKSEWTSRWRNLYTLRLYNSNARGRVAAYIFGSRRFLKQLADLGGSG